MAAAVTPPGDARGLARALINASQQPMLLFDGDLRVTIANRSFCLAFDLPDDQADGCTLAELGAGEWNLPPLRSLLENVRADGPARGDCDINIARIKMEPRRLIVNAQKVVYAASQDAPILLTVSDVTDARRIAEVNISLLLEKDGLLKERGILMQEMQHRIANSLQIIASILMLKARAVKSVDTRRHLRDAHDRVMSVAAVQQHLQESLGDVEVGPYLTKLAQSLASSMIRESRSLALEVHSDVATVSSHHAVSLGLIVTELVINALKHAFPNGRGGLIEVAYRVGSQGWTLSVSDDGIGRPAEPPARKAGLGTTVVEALARQLGAKVSISDAHPGTKIDLTHLEATAV
jgi:two-component system, sensor histidine kinase PdtaS